MKPAKADTVRLSGRAPYRVVVDEVLRGMPEASRTDTCPMCGQSGPHEHTALESVIYTNGVKLGMKMAVLRRPNEGKLMFAGSQQRAR